MDSLSLYRWRRIDTLFSEALDLAADAREAHVRAACRGDATLYEEVMALLQDSAEAAALFGESVTEFAAPLLPGLEEALCAEAAMPDRIGPYRVVRELARGGMGAVYLAERDDDQYRQRVALKLVKRGMDTDEILRRFRYERQILAGLQHPHIARLLDGGMAPDGRPYLVMEYVEGLPIDRYCDAHRLDVDARLALFEDVCEAVRYAHQQLVVHRDLKPSNILVTTEGRVKLLDFGIAKLLADDEPGWSVPVTRTGVQVLTPAYASPEQLRGEPVTTATDVYALGVILYELLTGRHPSDRSHANASIAHALTAGEPLRPSAAAGRAAPPEKATATPQAISAARRASPERLRRRLRGDLDTIVLMALHEDTTRRYPSAEALRADLQRHRAGLPVEARPDTLSYRVHTFVRRHRIGVGFAAALAALVLSFGGVYTVRVTQERDRAEQAALRAQAATDFLEQLFEGADPDATLGDTLNVFQLLDRGATQLHEAFVGQPVLRSDLQDRLGRLYTQLGAYDKAEPLLTDALETRSTLAGGPEADVVQSLMGLAYLNGRQGRYARAESLFTEALARQTRTYGPGHTEAARVQAAYGGLLVESGKYRQAEPLLNEALAQLLPDSAETWDAMASARLQLAVLHRGEARYDEAEALYKQVLATYHARYGAINSRVAKVMNNLGNVYANSQRYDEADSLLMAALGIRKRLFGSNHPEVSNGLNNLSIVYYERGDFETAEQMLRESLAIVEALIGKENNDYGMSLNNFGFVIMRQGHLERAEAVFREALGIMQRNVGAMSPEAGLLLGNVGFVLQRQGRPAAAEPFFREALLVRMDVHGAESMHVAWRQFALAEVLREQGKLVEAEALHRSSVALRRRLRDPGHFDVGRGLNGLGRTLVIAERYTAAEPILREAEEIFTALDHTSLAITQDWLGACLTGLGRYDEAEPLLLASYEAMPDDPDVRRHLAMLYDAWGKPERAATYQ